GFSRDWSSDVCSSDLTAQRVHQVADRLRQLAAHHREVDVELLQRVDVLGLDLAAGLLHLLEVHPLDLQLVGEHEGDAAVPGQAQDRQSVEYGKCQEQR